MVLTTTVVALVLLYNITTRESIVKGAVEMSNFEIRQAMKENRLYNYEVAAALGISEFTLSRKMRNELDENEKKKILEVIDKLAQERRG